MKIILGVNVLETSMIYEFDLVRCFTYIASKANANTPAASGAAALVPECVVVHFPYKSVVATPVFGSFAPLLKVLANVELPVLYIDNKTKLEYFSDLFFSSQMCRVKLLSYSFHRSEHFDHHLLHYL